jgi:ferric-dicitrate binding protein FerR (iron transport regulator)
MNPMGENSAMRGIRIGLLIIVTCWLAGCASWLAYDERPLAEVIQAVQRGTPRRIELEGNAGGILVVVLYARGSNTAATEEWVGQMPLWIPVTVDETATAFHVRCVQADCDWPKRAEGK